MRRGYPIRTLVLWAILALLAAAPSSSQESQHVAGGKARSYFSTFPQRSEVALDPAIKAELEGSSGDLGVENRSVEATREFIREAVERMPKLHEPIARAVDRTVPGTDGAVPVRIYMPVDHGRFPVIFFIHGGGWVFGSVEVYDDLCRSLCHRTGALVVSVDYRLAPEHKFPAPLEDCYAALKWTSQHAGELGGNGRLSIAGDSSGGNLAAAVALEARDRKGPHIAYQVLIYPVTNYSFETLSYFENANGLGLSRSDMIWFWKQYLGKPADGDNPYASPLRARDLSGLPPALVLTAQYDPLRDDGEAYAARLNQAGVPVRCTRYLEMNHGFITGGAKYPQANRAVQQIADSLRRALSR